jgi:serine phosphatase RsbU (regulator of sigma subunit)
MSENNQHQIDQIQHVFEKQRKELNESLKYASYIQKALLPSEVAIERNFPDHFLIYLPCDIVSGDFYWMYTKKDKLFFAIADCTGHGVPGAFLSILGLSFLNQVVDRNVNASPATILNILREYIMKALHQTGESSEQKDGIDMSLIIIETSTGKMHFSGAFHSAYIIREASQLVEISGDKMPIGVAAEEEVSFNDHIFELKKGDMVYLFTDGYIDQFGGIKGKKFKYQPFRKLLLSISNLNVHQQKSELIREFHSWKGSLNQLDDISIFGFRYQGLIK